MSSAAHKQFMAIYTDNADAIFRFSLIRISDREVAKDLTQETFTRLWQALEQGQEMTNGRAFVFTIARRLIIDWYRKQKPLSLESMNDDETGETYEIVDSRALEEILTSTESWLFIQALGKITPGNRDALYLRFIEDVSPTEIAEILNITPNAVSVRINRGLAELRELLHVNIESK